MRLVAALVVLAGASGCVLPESGNPDGGASPGVNAVRQSVSMSFGQLPSQVGTDHGLLRVVNTGRDGLAVKRVGLDWVGYARPFLVDEDNVLRAGETVDFPVTLPAPECTGASGPVLGVVDTGEARLRTRLDREGTVLLRRNRRQGCTEEFTVERLRIEYGRSWRLSGHGASAAMTGDLRLSRVTGRDVVRLLGVEGSVLYDLGLPGRRTLSSGSSTTTVPLRITPGNRCDEHAHSQATAPFAFRLALTIGERHASVSLPPPPRVQAKVPTLLRLACR